MFTAAEHKRNYTACLKDHGYCDRSRLTAVPFRRREINPGKGCFRTRETC